MKHDLVGDGQAGGCAVVIVAYNNAEAIRDTIECARASGTFDQIVVVDNGTDNSAGVAEEAGAFVIRRCDNPGFGTAQNLGVAATSTPFVLLLNPDAYLDAGAVPSGLAWMFEHPRTAMVQGVITNQFTNGPERSAGDEVRPIHLIGRLFRLRALLSSGLGRWAARFAGVNDHVDRIHPEPISVEMLAATAVIVRRCAFDEVCGFDERFFLYGEDLDICRRLRAAGWDLVSLPQAWARHDSGGSFSSTWTRELQWWRGTLTFAALWWEDPAWRLAGIATLLRWVSMAARNPKFARATWRALVTEPRATRAAGRR